MAISLLKNSLSTIGKTVMGTLSAVLFWPIILFMLIVDKSERYRSQGLFSFDATGDIEGHFAGVATTAHSHSLSSAGKSYMIVLEIPDLPPVSGGRSARLRFVFEDAPATGVFHVNDSQGRDSIRKPSVRAHLNSGDRPTEMWSGSFGELRLETAPDGDPGMIGDFSFRLVADNGRSSTRAAECIGRFDTNAPGVRSTNGFSRVARRVWRTPVVQAVVFVPRLMYAIVGIFVLLLVFTVHQAFSALRQRSSRGAEPPA